jgi:hypothetical protein
MGGEEEKEEEEDKEEDEEEEEEEKKGDRGSRRGRKEIPNPQQTNEGTRLEAYRRWSSI